MKSRNFPKASIPLAVIHVVFSKNAVKNIKRAKGAKNARSGKRHYNPIHP